MNTKTTDELDPNHCDVIADDPSQPEVLRVWLNWARLPAHGLLAPKPHPELYADFEGQRVRVTMASRFGDVGITRQLDSDCGYFTRVPLDRLTNFGDKP